MSKNEHVKKNSENKLKRKQNKAYREPRTKKASSKQIAIMRSLDILPEKKINMNDAALIISEALKNV